MLNFIEYAISWKNYSMSVRKIIFLITTGILILAWIVTVIWLWSSWKKSIEIPESITFWITEWSTEWFAPLVQGFQAYAPEYKNMKIIVEKKTSDPIRYRTLLLSTLADWTGPDIFILNSGEDRILEGKRETIDESVFPITEFEKEYEDIFLWLVSTWWSIGDNIKKWILWVPLGYETLWIFYNKWLVREVPKTWNQIEKLYKAPLWNERYPTNLWLWPRYTPNASDILPIFSINWATSYKSLAWDNDAIESYINYASLWQSQQQTLETPDSIETDIYTPINKPESLMDLLESEKKTTYDLFMQGDIALIIGYPSVVRELEKSTKRAGINSAENLILTESLPQETLWWNRKNMARYPYVSISKSSKNPLGAAKFLEYLSTDDAIRKLQSIYPYLIPPKPSLYESWRWNKLSSVLNRTTLDAFIPQIDEKIALFDYWLKPEFESFLSENIDRKENIDISNIWSRLASFIDCSLDIYTWNNNDSSPCEK